MSNKGFQIFKANYKNPKVNALLVASEEYANSLYPPEGVFMLSLDEMDNDNIHLFAIKDNENEVKACGAVVIINKLEAEVKRMYTHPSARGNGLGKMILGKLEEVAREQGVKYMRLETGPLQPKAINLYEKNGYVKRGPFGDYKENEMSVFMEKKLINKA